MFRFGKACVGLVLVILAGCAAPSRNRYSNTEPAPVPARVAPEPVLAPPPSSPPPPAPAVPANHFAGPWIPLNRWCASNALPAPVLVRTTPLPAYALKSANGALLLSTTSTAAYWEGLELRLARAPQVIDGQPHVHTLDLQRTIRPLLNGGFLEALPGQPVIVIDPGHGGEDVGTKSVLGNRYEKEFTLDWGRRLAALLGARGWRVYLTRTNDATVAISNRVAFADSRNASLFVSLHFNSAAPDVVQEGLETYCLTPVGMPSTLTRGYAEDPGAAFPNNSFDAQNLQFALRVHRALLEVNGRRDRGVRRARFLGVLRGQQRPAILVEGGYLSNLREARLIATPEYRQRLAEAVAGALMGPREGKGLEPVAALAEPAKPRETPSQKTVGANSKPAPDRAVSAGARTSSLP